MSVVSRLINDGKPSLLRARAYVVLCRIVPKLSIVNQYVPQSAWIEREWIKFFEKSKKQSKFLFHI